MTARFSVVWQTAKFLAALKRLTGHQPALRDRVYRSLNKYYGQVDTLDRTIIRNPKRRIFHTAVGREMRLVDEPLDPTRPGEVAILYIDHHDAANDWAARYTGDTLATIERATRLERGRPTGGSEGTHALETAKGPTTSGGGKRGRTGDRKTDARPPARRSSSGKIGQYVTVAKLRQLKIPRALAPAVLAANAEADLVDIGISEETAQRVSNWYASKLPLQRIPLPVPALEAPEAIAVARAELRTVLTLSLPQLLAGLTDEQRALARRENRNLYVVKGAAGSGKTVVGIRRIEYLSEQRELFDKPILFLCYNKVLANAARQMIEDTLRRPLADAGVEVRVAYEMMAELAREIGLPAPRNGYRAPERLLPHVRDARRADRDRLLSKWSDRAILDEILEVIYGRTLQTLAEYVATNRKGRGRRLDKARQRPALWSVHERLRATCERLDIAPWDQLPARVARHLSANTPVTPRYSAVVIDEAQDLLPSIFRVILALQCGQDNNFLVLGDAAQNVYRSGFRWGHTGLSPLPGQVTSLTRCFRSTPNVIGAARPLIAGQLDRLQGDLVMPEGVGEVGPMVSVTLSATTEAELDSIAYAVTEKIEQGVPPSAIAVLLDDSRQRAALRRRLEILDCSVEDFVKGKQERRIDIFDQSVKLLAVASAKGIEFQTVFVPGITHKLFPATDDDGEAADRARRVLYTAMTRCAWELHLSAPADTASDLLYQLGSAHVNYLGVPRSSAAVSPDVSRART